MPRKKPRSAPLPARLEDDAPKLPRYTTGRGRFRRHYSYESVHEILAQCGEPDENGCRVWPHWSRLYPPSKGERIECGLVNYRGQTWRIHHLFWLAWRHLPIVWNSANRLAGGPIITTCGNRLCIAGEHVVAAKDAPPSAFPVGGRHNALKTECPYGHPYDAANTYFNSRGQRVCRTCQRERYWPRQNERRRARLLEETWVEDMPITPITSRPPLRPGEPDNSLFEETRIHA